MLRHYVFLVIVLSSSSVVWSMKEIVPMDRIFGLIIPRDLSLLSFGDFLDSDNVQERIELGDLTEQENQERMPLLKSPQSIQADCMHAMYHSVRNFLVSQHPDYAALLRRISDGKYLKRFDIDADQMGRFAFQYDHAAHVKTSLFFYFLKNSKPFF